jgi:lipoic acid synthetase/lipoyl(octanoyl) transferase
MPVTPRRCTAVFLGRSSHASAHALQVRIETLRKRGEGEDALLLVEHPPTVTLGRNGTWNNLRVDREVLRRRGVEAVDVDRGGDITFHGPGQLVGYPILRLEGPERDVARYMRALEEVLIRTLARYGIAAGREAGLTGVWTSRGKIAALGVHLSRWVTRHGFALNVATDLGFFDLIVPCGLAGRPVATMAACLGRELALEAVARDLVEEFGPVFGREVVWSDEASLRSAVGDL